MKYSVIKKYDIANGPPGCVLPCLCRAVRIIAGDASSRKPGALIMERNLLPLWRMKSSAH